VIAVTRRYEFPAAHVLSSPELSEEENRRIFGKCANPKGHGHDYRLEITVTGPVDEQCGQIIAPTLLDELYQQIVADRYSHRMLNELECFASRVPTAENIAQLVFEDLAPAVARSSSARLARVRLVESSNNSFAYGEL
jgi:6-pyruvoyltetrahydropterin/6-carboxytetrahydropterin synthase